jgi:carbon monoxide dehydrogenase subunit G
MRFENTFDVQAPVDEVYATMLDVERVAPCVPGAEVLERVGDDAFKVGIRVRVGPMSMQYRGEIEIVERDPDQHRAVMTARAKEARGQGTANARVELRLTGDESRTHGDMTADVQLAGRMAGMGQAVIQDVSARIIDTFAQNLAAMLERPAEASPAESAPAEVSAAEAAPAPAAPSELPVLEIAGGVARDRLRNPRLVVGLLAGIALVVAVLWRARR